MDPVNFNFSYNEFVNVLIQGMFAKIQAFAGLEAPGIARDQIPWYEEQ